MPTNTDYYQKKFLHVCILGLILVIIFYHFPGIDFYLADVFWQPGQYFYLKNNVLLTHVLHTWLKYVLIISMLVIMFKTLLQVRWQIYKLIPTLLGIALTCLGISLWKHVSAHACPWDLIQYGGKLMPIPWLSWQPALKDGGCFPAGHSATGFAWLFLCFLPNTNKPQKHLYLGIMFGLMLGFGQQMRGAHFLSHTLASLWWALLVWAIIGMLHMQSIKKRK